MLKLIIFDFDGLILDTEYPEYLSWLDIYRSFGLELAISTWAGMIGRGASTISKTPYDDLEEKMGFPIDRSGIRAKRRERFLEFMQAERIRPGVLSLLEEARRRSVLVGLASSSPKEWVHGYLRELKIADYFDVVKCGDEVNLAKPDPELYLSVLAELGVEPNQAVALEDSPNGIAAAKAAGIYCVAVPNELTRHTSLAAADRLLASLELLSLSEFCV
jgi:HAD superfamily hydrolase (TIGR01509 family)